MKVTSRQCRKAATIFIVLALMSISSFVFAACGNNGDDTETGATAPAATVTGAMDDQAVPPVMTTVPGDVQNVVVPGAPGTATSTGAGTGTVDSQ